MKKVYTTEHVREQERKYFKSFYRFFIAVFVLGILTFLADLNLNLTIIAFLIVFLLIGAILFSSFIYQTIKLKWIVSKRDPDKEGKKLTEELGISKLSFYKLSDGSLEMHHNLYKKKEMNKMLLSGLSSEEITRVWQSTLNDDFKRLESFVRKEELKGSALVIHTYTHVRMYKIWNRIARDAGFELEVMEGNNQKPVGFTWRAWKDGVYRTNGKKAIKGSIPDDSEWNKYVLTSKAE